MQQTQSIPAEWSEADSNSARMQGWDLCATHVEDDIEVAFIRQAPSSGVFQNNEEALLFVRRQAAAGDPLANKAVQLDYECICDRVASCQVVDGSPGR